MFMEHETLSSTEPVPVNTIRVETALSRFPVHRLARRGQIKIEVKQSNERGESSTKWKVSYDGEYGQPGPLAYKLDTLIINRRIEEARRPIPRILKLGSLSDICRELGLADSGKNRSDIKRSLFQNATANIKTKTEYRHSDGTEQTLEALFTRYSVILTGEKLPGGKKADGVYIVLNDVFINVINGAMARPLDYDYLKSLPPAPQRFYELLSYQIYAALKYDRPRAKLTYSEFCAHAPQTRHVDWEKVRSQMTKVLKLHKESGYIARVDYQDTTDGEGQPDWVMLFQPGPKARAEFRAFSKRGGPSILEIESSEVLPLLSDERQLEQELVKRGVSSEVAKKLMVEQPEEKIRQQIEILDYRLAGKKSEKIDDPAAWLVAAIRSPEGHAAPKGFVSEAEKLRRQEAKRTKELAADAETRRKRAEADDEKRLSSMADEKLAALTPDQLAELDAASLADATVEQLESEEGPFGNTVKLLRRRSYIARQLRAQQVLPADA
ncbi:hypothetical protein [Paludisphaera borealis]|uniref:Membrane protein involved in colicin uptake n=1 Tax=Paludisphaera borealis TaxID=1387353 RepID=A0A1U7CZB4_9BACT|nr:hypothetical protein [Paludisphaera borealis]APW64302.1 membrane protein involved in colicin uptake [Paludisphaera borealis]